MKKTGKALIVTLVVAGITAAALTVGTAGSGNGGQTEKAVAVFGVL